MRLLFLTNVPSPYRIHFFNELGKKCELTVLFQKRASSERNTKWVAESKNTYKSVFLKGNRTGVDNAFCPGVLKYLKREYDAIIICGNASPTEIIAIMYCRLRKIPYCLEGDGAFVKPGKRYKDIIKKYLISGASLFLSTCREQDKYYIYYGANQSKIKRYVFSSLFEKEILSSCVPFDEKKKIRQDLGIGEAKIILAVGQFVFRKGFDILLNATALLNKEIGVYIVGDNPTTEYLSIVEKSKLDNVHFVGFKSKEELKLYYKASDIFVLPTREDIWGLVVNEAMAYGLPVITTNRCNAGLELINEGENGFIIEVDNIAELGDKLNKAIESSSSMSKNALYKIKSYSIEKMVEDHISILTTYVQEEKTK